MSITPSVKQSHPWRTRLALFSALSFGFTGVPLALAGPAQADTSLRGCTVDPLKPSSHGSTQRVDFQIKVYCRDGRTVQIRQLRYEDDRGRRNDDFLGSSWFTESFDRHDGSITLHSYDRVPNLDRRGAEEVFQLVSFRVRTGHDNWSDWTRWEKSDVATVRR
jgi:hypothetical protein